MGVGFVRFACCFAVVSMVLLCVLVSGDKAREMEGRLCGRLGFWSRMVVGDRGSAVRSFKVLVEGDSGR